MGSICMLHYMTVYLTCVCMYVYAGDLQSPEKSSNRIPRVNLALTLLYVVRIRCPLNHKNTLSSKSQKYAVL